MPLQKNDVIELAIAKRLYEEVNPHEERLVASYLSGCMLWPFMKQDGTRYFYYALCFREIFAALEKALVADIYSPLQSFWVKEIFGSFDAYTQLLAAHQFFPAKGKGSLSERAWMGKIAGWVFKLALRDGCSLNEAALTVAEDIRKNRQDNEDLLSPSAENIIKNYWPEFSPVAHFWGAMEVFTLPEPSDSTVIRLDLACKHPQLDSQYDVGWRGILQVAQGLFNAALEAPRKQTSRPLLDPQKTVTIRFV